MPSHEIMLPFSYRMVRLARQAKSARQTFGDEEAHHAAHAASVSWAGRYYCDLMSGERVRGMDSAAILGGVGGCGTTWSLVALMISTKHGSCWRQLPLRAAEVANGRAILYKTMAALFVGTSSYHVIRKTANNLVAHLELRALVGIMWVTQLPRHA